MKKALEVFNNIFDIDDTVVCATSGGVDSMTLLNLLIEFRDNYKKIKIVCAHINHNLREESYEEYKFVESYAKQNKIDFEGKLLEKHKKGNFESESRKKRYQFFEQVLSKYSSKYLLTAHHGDDLIETMLMRVVRGSSLDGYKGFSLISDRKNYKIIRPLIYYSKDQIRKYATTKNIEYREDKTNYDTKYTRNRFRMNLLPLLKKENPNIHLKFLKLSKILDESSNFINNYVDKIYNELYIDNKIKINELLKLDGFITKKIVYKILSDKYGKNINKINDNHVEKILKIINSNKSNISINLPLNMIAVKNYDYFEIRNEVEFNDYKIEIKKDEIILPYGKIKIIKNTNLTNNYVCHLNSNTISLPLYVRNKKKGDSIDVLGLNGHKKVKDIFINSKLNLLKRNNYPIVVDSNDNILWIPGIKKSKYDSLKTKKYDIILWYIDEEE